MKAERDPGPSDGGDTLQLLVGGGRGEPEVLLVIERPDADGCVRVRTWTSKDWSSPPTNTARDASELWRDLERWSRAGRGLNQPLTVVRQWLVPSGR